MGLIVWILHSCNKVIWKCKNQQINHTQFWKDSTFNLSRSLKNDHNPQPLALDWCSLTAAAITLSLSVSASVARSISSWLMLNDHRWPSLSLPNVCLSDNWDNKTQSNSTDRFWYHSLALSLCSLQWQVPLTVALGNASTVCSESLIWINNKTGTLLLVWFKFYCCVSWYHSLNISVKCILWWGIHFLVAFRKQAAILGVFYVNSKLSCDCK